MCNSRYYYSETDVLGSGSYAKVYKGTDTRNYKPVAIKVMDLKGFSPEARDSLQAEIESLKKFTEKFPDARHVIKLFDQG